MLLWKLSSDFREKKAEESGWNCIAGCCGIYHGIHVVYFLFLFFYLFLTDKFGEEIMKRKEKSYSVLSCLSILVFSFFNACLHTRSMASLEFR